MICLDEYFTLLHVGWPPTPHNYFGRFSIQRILCPVICICFPNSPPWDPSWRYIFHFSPQWRFPKLWKFPDFPKHLNIPLLTEFSSIFPCSNTAGQLKPVYKKYFQNIIFPNIHTIFLVKNMIIYIFFAIKLVQNTSFCNIFIAFIVLTSKNPLKYRYFF